MRQFYAQNYAPKDYYLLDSLDLDALTDSDKELIETSLKEYHKAKHDTDKINALTFIYNNLTNEDLKKYQYFQYEFIKKAFQRNNEKQTKKYLTGALAICLNDIGNIYFYKGNYTKSLKNFKRSLKLYEEIGAKKGMATSHINIGNVYYRQGNIPLALEYLHKSLKLYEELGLKKNVAEAIKVLDLFIICKMTL